MPDPTQLTITFGDGAVVAANDDGTTGWFEIFRA